MTHTETDITPAESLRFQLADILVNVPGRTLERLAQAEFFAVFDWVDAVKESAARMLPVPPPPAGVKRYLTTEQCAGEWQSFTTWRPPPPKKEQKGLFA